MRIAVNARFLLKDKLEGIGWFTHEVCRRLVNDHPEHEFLFVFDRFFDQDFIFASNVIGVPLPPPARHPLLWYCWFEWSLPFLFRQYQPDVFFSPDGYLSLRSKAPTAMVTHDIAHVHFPEQLPLLVRKYYHYFVPRYIKKAESIITVSNFVKNDIVSTYKVPEKKIRVACNGAREAFRPLEEAEKAKIKAQYSKGADYFFYLGAVHPRKNVHRLIQAFDLFKQQNNLPVKLLIGGRFAWQTGEVKTAYEQAIHQSDIHFLGYLKEEEVPGLMGAATALTYPSNFEGFGIPILEALHCDVPVITSEVSSMPEVAGEAGILVNPEKVHEIAAAMKVVLVDEKKRSGMIEEGREWRKQFSWEKAAEVCYQGILDAVEGR